MMLIEIFWLYFTLIWWSCIWIFIIELIFIELRFIFYLLLWWGLIFCLITWFILIVSADRFGCVLELFRIFYSSWILPCWFIILAAILKLFGIFNSRKILQCQFVILSSILKLFRIFNSRRILIILPSYTRIKYIFLSVQSL